MNPLIKDDTFSSDSKGTLEWINKTPDPEKNEAVKFALKRQFFKPKKSVQRNKTILGINDLL